MLNSAILRRERLFGEVKGCESISVDFAPDASVPLSLSGGPDYLFTMIGLDRYAASWDRWSERSRNNVTTYELLEGRRAELLALVRELEAARGLLTDADLVPWVERFADLMEEAELRDRDGKPLHVGDRVTFICHWGGLPCPPRTGTVRAIEKTEARVDDGDPLNADLEENGARVSSWLPGFRMTKVEAAP
jgi:hypothetical protein